MVYGVLELNAMNEIPHATEKSTGTTTYHGTATLDGIAVSVAALAGFLSLLVAPTVTAGALVGAVALKGVQTLTETDAQTTPPPENGTGGGTQIA